MNAITRAVHSADGLQQRRPMLAFPVAVWKKFGDDQAGYLAALISYYGFAALFPLLLVLVTVLNIVLKNDPALRDKLLNSALAQYPVIGKQLKPSTSISGTGLPLVFGIVLLTLGARGVAGAMQNALCEVWGIARKDRPGFPLNQLSGLGLVLTIGLGFIATTFLSGVAAGAGHLLTGVGAQIIPVVVSLVLNVGVFWASFRIATVGRVRWRDLRTGAIIAAAVWQLLQFVGGYVVTHQLNRASDLYGTFGLVLGLLAWLYLQAEVTLYAAEIDVVLTKRLWPRSIIDDAAAPGDERAVPAAPGLHESAAPGLDDAAAPGDERAVPDDAPSAGPAEAADRTAGDNKPARR
jgi:membrane protein